MKEITTDHIIRLSNATAAVATNLFGGAITDFHLRSDTINPLSFEFSGDQMPPNNKNGAPYRGHFLCLGRWGHPSAEEIKAGIPSHGQIANMMWQAYPLTDRHTVQIRADSPLEGLLVERTIRMDDNAAVFGVDESVVNTQPLGRLYNMVQHPTLASPFLHNATSVNCNASLGFDQFRYSQRETDVLTWPTGRNNNDEPMDLKAPDQSYDSVFSFVVDRAARHGWVTAFSPKHQLLLGYIWKRSDYPWIHLWQHWQGQNIQYRGIEFGTAGIHQPFKNILETGVKLLGEKTVEYIEPAETVNRRYLCFLQKTDKNVQEITVQNGGEHIVLHTGSRPLSIHTSFKDFL